MNQDSNDASALVKGRAFDAAFTANSIANSEGNLTEANGAFLKTWGLARQEEVIGKPIAHFFNDPHKAEAIVTALDGMGYWEGDFIAKRHDGSTFVAYGLATVVRDEEGRMLGYQSAVMDITARRQAEQSLRELNATLEHRVLTRTLKLNQSEGRFRMLAEASFEGIAVSEGGILLDGNSQLAACLGYELVEITGRPVMDFIAPESRALVAERIGTGEGSSEECVGLRKDGSTFPVAIHTRMGTWQGRITQITVLRDLSEAKQAAAVLHAQQTQLEHVQRLALVSEVNAGIIHQISQPLCAMAANIASVTTRLEACKQEHCGVQGCDSLGTIKDIDADIARMRSIVIQLRTLIDPEQPLHKEIDFNHTLATVLPLLRQKAATARVRLAVELGQDLPPVQANAVQMDQVIYNLVNNACEACSDVPPERRLVVLTTRALAGEGIELCVRDAGSGIPPAILPRLFTPFFSTKAAGFGIGLRISQTIVQTHGGSISGFNNANGHGATFRVVLPLHPPNKRQKVMDWDSR